jgi:hypothetical protein
MSRAGKFVPGGAGRKTTKVGLSPSPIRAPDGSPNIPAPGKSPSGNRLLSKGAGLMRPVPKNRRLPILIMSSITCCLLVSFAWYEVGVLPAKRQAAEDRQKAAEAQKQLADNVAAEKSRQEAAAKARLAAQGTVVVDSKPPGTVTIGSEHKATPATFDDVPTGTVSVLIQSDGYEDYRQDVTLAAGSPTDLGTVQLAPQTGNLSLTTVDGEVTYTLTGPNSYNHAGQLPDKMANLPAGDYQLTVRLADWELPPFAITIHDKDNLQRVIRFPFGTATITTVPAGGTVRNGNSVLGQTPLTLSQLHPGVMNLSVDLPPYNLERFTLTIPDFGNVTKAITLQQGRDFIAACGMPMVWIPDGFWVGKYEVTQRVFESVTGYNPSSFRRPNRPVETVSWDEAAAFCDKLNQSERKAGKLPSGYHYTLPTETQWDSFNADADINKAAMSRFFTLSSTQDVGASEPNKYGLYDTLGNVWEWCLDTVDQAGDHSLRGGSWLSSADNFPSAETRSAAAPKYSDRFTGFRVVLVPDAK